MRAYQVHGGGRLGATEGFAERRELGAGSFGIVYRGEANGREFAVKRLNDSTSAERELAVLARFQHPHVIRLLGVTPAGTAPRCLVYELAARGSDVLAHLLPQPHAEAVVVHDCFFFFCPKPD